jgi:hypothetical protein
VADKTGEFERQLKTQRNALEIDCIELPSHRSNPLNAHGAMLCVLP